MNRTLIELPPRFAGLAADVRSYGAWMRGEAQRRVGHVFPKIELPPPHRGAPTAFRRPNRRRNWRFGVMANVDSAAGVIATNRQSG